MRMINGRPDLVGDAWVQEETWIDERGNDWWIFSRAQGHNSDWINYRVIANGKVQSKANYWFSINKKTKQMAFARDLKLMQEFRPTLHAKIISHITTMKGK